MPTSRLTRRRLVGTAAWTAPAIVVATAVPAFAMSTPGFTVSNRHSYRGNSAADSARTDNTGSSAFLNFRVTAGSVDLMGSRLTITPASGSNGLTFSTASALGIYAKSSPAGTATTNSAPFVFDAASTIQAGSSADLNVVFSGNTWAAADAPFSLVFSATNLSATVSFVGYSGNSNGFAVTGAYDLLNPPPM